MGRRDKKMVGECGRQRKMYREVCVGGRFIEMRKMDMVVSYNSATTHLLDCILQGPISLALKFCIFIVTHI